MAEPIKAYGYDEVNGGAWGITVGGRLYSSDQVRAALRAPEPLTAEPVAWRCTAPGSDKPALLERDIGLAPFGWLVEPLYLGAALEGGVSPQHYGDVKGTFADPTARFETAVQRPAVVEEMYSFICSVADNLGDMPISDQYAEKTSRRAWALMRELSEFVIVADWENAQRVKARLAETQRSSSGARSDKTEVEGGVSRTEPALTDLLVEARGWFVADPANPIGVILKDARGERIRDWLIEVDRVIATKSHPSGDQGL